MFAPSWGATFSAGDPLRSGKLIWQKNLESLPDIEIRNGILEAGNYHEVFGDRAIMPTLPQFKKLCKIAKDKKEKIAWKEEQEKKAILRLEKEKTPEPRKPLSEEGQKAMAVLREFCKGRKNN